MFPIRDDNPHFLVPVVTYTLVIVNILAWVLLQGLGSEPVLTNSICSLGLVPAEVLQSAASGAARSTSDGICVRNAPGGSLSLITHMFLHGGWMHIISNMWFLWIFGNNVEDSMGHLRFIVFYLLCGLAAAGLQLAFEPGSTIPMVGASGAISGVMGAYILLYPRVSVHLLVVLGFFISTFAVPAFWMLAYWFVLQLFGGFSSVNSSGGVAFWAHIGGFIAGMVLILIFRDPKLIDRHPYHGWRKRSPNAYKRIR